MISVRFQGKPFNNTVIQVYALTSNAEEAERLYEDLQDLLELTPPKDVLFIIGGLECKSRKSKNTWSNRQLWSWQNSISLCPDSFCTPRPNLPVTPGIS